MNPLYIIPSYNNIEKSLELANKYNAAFEYNDFYNPDLLDNPDELKNRISFYLDLDRDRSKDTLHACFFDITIHSSDKKIRDISEARIRQSLDIASKLGIYAIIIHTNFIENFNVKSYYDQWINLNEIFIRKMSKEYPDINIFMENMFDLAPTQLAWLAQKLSDCETFGVCFDIAHANLSPLPIKDWYASLHPFIKHIHINDNKGIIDSHDIPGQGNIDWLEVSNMLSNTNYTALLELTNPLVQEEALITMSENHIFPFE